MRVVKSTERWPTLGAASLAEISWGAPPWLWDISGGLTKFNGQFSGVGNEFVSTEISPNIRAELAVLERFLPHRKP